MDLFAATQYSLLSQRLRTCAHVCACNGPVWEFKWLTLARGRLCA